MAYNVTLYSFSKRVNSTKQPSGTGTTVSGTLKFPSSILNPVMEFTAPVSNPSNLNYAYIAEFSRYYWINDWTFDRGFWIASMSVDVLASYKVAIGSDSEYVIRAASASDGDIVDVKYPSKARPNGDFHSLGSINSYMQGNGTYVIGLKSGQSNTGLAFYAVDAANLATLVQYMFSDVWLNASDITKSLQKLLVNPIDYISSCYWYPMTLPTNGGQPLYFGYWDSGATGTKIGEGGRVDFVQDSVTLDDHPQISRGAYLNGAPFTRLCADVYGFGRIPLDPDLFIRSRSVTFTLRVDLFTGMGELMIDSTTGRAAKVSAMVGVPVQLSQVTQDLIKPMLAVVNAGVGIATGNYVGATAGIADAIQSSMPQIQSSGSTGSKIAYSTDARLYHEWYEIVDEDNTTMGRPLCKVRTINTLSGFIQCENVDIDTIGTKEEKQQIISYMESGFFYE